jgi:hypothetical protein
MVDRNCFSGVKESFDGQNSDIGVSSGGVIRVVYGVCRVQYDAMYYAVHRSCSAGATAKIIDLLSVMKLRRATAAWIY